MADEFANEKLQLFLGAHVIGNVATFDKNSRDSTGGIDDRLIDKVEIALFGRARALRL